jgi:hypothetical protein
VHAAELNDLQLVIVRLASDQSSVNSNSLVLVPGLAVSVEANSAYAFDGYIGYNAGATGDFKINLTVSSGATGDWGLAGLATGATANGGTEGDVRMELRDGFGGTSLAVSGYSNNGGRMFALPRSYVATGNSVGSVGVMFGQNTSNATPSVIKAGSWIRLWKIT